MDYRVPDPSRVWPVLQRSRRALADLGAHYVLLYTSIREYGRVMVTMSLRSKEPVLEVLRSQAFLAWFDAVGLEDIPAIFAGETVEKIAVADPETDAPGVIMATITQVADVPVLIARIHRALGRFADAGIRNLRVFQAFDDDHETMILQEIDTEQDAIRWIDHPDEVAEWMAGSGVGAYPPIFVGELQHIMRIDENA
ncbi:fatty-acid--CoA ligase [Mycolicibacterium sp. CH28]|uniref:fatty-acid--CoA ligase n=1 Tax=Mycolicibacterium sp. CH28 TaxID=2512237 RepID=UPI0010801647|nr:fatty-acid--CoA ligase [Mycolicibacterium sp. CH28]TGD88580.1 fatty-acid--CoA ligase [Mycolicibacterium sp. CH28]